MLPKASCCQAAFRNLISCHSMSQPPKQSRSADLIAHQIQKNVNIGPLLNVVGDMNMFVVAKVLVASLLGACGCAGKCNEYGSCDNGYDSRHRRHNAALFHV